VTAFLAAYALGAGITWLLFWLVQGQMAARFSDLGYSESSWLSRLGFSLFVALLWPLTIWMLLGALRGRK
jgi:hypothetical protein